MPHSYTNKQVQLGGAGWLRGRGALRPPGASRSWMTLNKDKPRHSHLTHTLLLSSYSLPYLPPLPLFLQSPLLLPSTVSPISYSSPAPPYPCFSPRLSISHFLPSQSRVPNLAESKLIFYRTKRRRYHKLKNRSVYTIVPWSNLFYL